MTPARIQELRALCEAATPGPWGWYKCGKEWLLWADHGMREVVIDARRGNLRLRDFAKCLMIPFSPAHPDAALIAAAPTALPEALDEIVRLREALSDHGLRECEECGKYSDDFASEDGEYEAHCMDCYGKATHQCSECGFRTSAPDGFDGKCAMSGCCGDLIARAALEDE